MLVPFGPATLPHLTSPYKGEEKNSVAPLRLTILSTNFGIYVLVVSAPDPVFAGASISYG